MACNLEYFTHTNTLLIDASYTYFSVTVAVQVVPDYLCFMMIVTFVYLICYTNILLITPQGTRRQQKRDAVLFVIKE